MAVQTSAHQRVLRKLESIFDLTDHDRAAIYRIPLIPRVFKAGQDIVREGDRPSQCCALLEGFACRHRVMPTGKRQIFSFHIPGDMPDLQSIHLDVMDHNLTALVTSEIAFIPHDVVRELLRSRPHISDALWRDTLIDAAVFREWIANVGCRGAYARTAHLLCELFVRMAAIGRTIGAAYPMPVTQQDLGDALGLSTVHVNRTLQELRANGLISTQRRSVVVEDWEGLQEAGEFEPTYLHLRKEAA